MGDESSVDWGSWVQGLGSTYLAFSLQQKSQQAAIDANRTVAAGAATRDGQPVGGAASMDTGTMVMIGVGVLVLVLLVSR